jgi:hypothetical protein
MIPEEIAQFKDDADIERSIEIMENIVKDDEQSEQQSPAKPAAKPESKKEGDDQQAADPSVLVIENEDELDPAIVKTMKAQHKKNYELEQRLNAQDAKIGAEEQRLKEEREKVAMSRFDEKIEALGKEYYDTFGKGNTLAMSKRSTARKNRNKLGRHFTALGKAMLETGQEVTADELFDMALRNVFFKKVQSVNGGKIYTKTSRRARQQISRASAKQTGRQTRQQQAVAVSEEFDELMDASEDVT